MWNKTTGIHGKATKSDCNSEMKTQKAAGVMAVHYTFLEDHG